ncbi:MAG: diadenylate cyclase CdaA [Candidatus Marinimicrobia bacterium]|nr:diadenylate cyclase CdaA [Candidatus Neomarinimicrobiota bacterium]
MIELFKIGFISFTLLDLIDIVLVAFIFYIIYQLFKDSRASQMLIGMILLAVSGVVAQALNLKALTWLLGSLTTAWVILFVIVFQKELRRVLLFLGRVPLVKQMWKDTFERYEEELISSVLELQDNKIGALIVVLRDKGLASIIEKGVVINADISNQLISSIFNTSSPLHDGAIITLNGKIIAAKCILPLSENIDIDPTIGTRHLAGLGLSEESDSFVIIISEETNKVSVALNGIITRGLDESTLRTELTKYLAGRND